MSLNSTQLTKLMQQSPLLCMPWVAAAIQIGADPTVPRVPGDEQVSHHLLRAVIARLPNVRHRRILTTWVRNAAILARLPPELLPETDYVARYVEGIITSVTNGHFPRTQHDRYALMVQRPYISAVLEVWRTQKNPQDLLFHLNPPVEAADTPWCAGQCVLAMLALVPCFCIYLDPFSNSMVEKLQDKFRDAAEKVDERNAVILAILAALHDDITPEAMRRLLSHQPR